MLALESPAIVDGLEAWKEWKRKLASMPVCDRKDDRVVAEIARAERMIKIFETYPQGLSSNSPGFKAAVRASRMVGQ